MKLLLTAFLATAFTLGFVGACSRDTGTWLTSTDPDSTAPPILNGPCERTFAQAIRLERMRHRTATRACHTWDCVRAENQLHAAILVQIDDDEVRCLENR